MLAFSPLRALLVALFLCFNVSALDYRGADISSLLEVEANNITYKDVNGRPGSFLSIVKEHGLNAARVRIWTAGVNNLTYALKLGKEIKEAGITLMIDLHYSDTWADPGHQATPTGWGTTVPELTVSIYNYTRDVVLAFAAQGTPIDVLQTGNEITNGLLWPTGANNSTMGWKNAAQYLHSARMGAAAANFKGKVLIHLDNGWNETTQLWWYSNAISQGTFSLSDFDIMGGSFYPFYGTNATLAALNSSFTALVKTYNKTIIVAETDYPALPCNTSRLEGGGLSENFPLTPFGQEEWVYAIQEIMSGLPWNRGQGILYWEPGWVGAASLGSGCPDNLVFTPTGQARISVNIFERMKADVLVR